MCCATRPHVSLDTIFETSRYRCRQNTLLIRLLKTLQQPKNSFALMSPRKVKPVLDCKRFITNRGDIISAGLMMMLLMMSPRLVMKRLQSNCPARRTDQQSIRHSEEVPALIITWMALPSPSRPESYKLALPQNYTRETVEGRSEIATRRRDEHISINTLICKLIWFCERLTWNPAESLVCDVSRQLNLLHQAASCFSCYGIRDSAIHAQSSSFRQPYVLLEPKLGLSQNQIDLQMSVFVEISPIWVRLERKVDRTSGTAPT
ncbi:hypothetical protein CSKR_112395 [Clonorchis sinensis]|uniref:Uncharacterized protein n=1 Tax=Clonorchis sinensis TaxID=79923 RepID=A0A3R7D6F2_CLOSI|nr:hypothetical protein CSKR_112395 [Clonorchis sinensis]